MEVHCYNVECKFCVNCICGKGRIFLNDGGQDEDGEQLLVCENFEADEAN